ncbi:hypothetical protein MAPG_08703 [Magnaporthiopsis poae ATCC 64411]|uniref:Uncharacterized protein n=1 Tax=Magnaporthiopsis poae (strain ATCC 64411 / 73-15) TaxID=644358 RepID=A0A0C4E817_MAGP6|nr:hypothetical protein MAPG_08703 [Magnaporthiopsis poae ATCC 64411]
MGSPTRASGQAARQPQRTRTHSSPACFFWSFLFHPSPGRHETMYYPRRKKDVFRGRQCEQNRSGNRRRGGARGEGRDKEKKTHRKTQTKGITGRGSRPVRPSHVDVGSQRLSRIFQFGIRVGWVLCSCSFVLCTRRHLPLLPRCPPTFFFLSAPSVSWVGGRRWADGRVCGRLGFFVFGDEVVECGVEGLCETTGSKKHLPCVWCAQLLGQRPGRAVLLCGKMDFCSWLVSQIGGTSSKACGSE